MSGRILLQVEENGEAWYINPADFKKYFLNRPKDAFDLMRGLGIGITNNNLNKIPIGLIDYTDSDSDSDGLADRLETALGTNPQNKDSDGDGFLDKEELAGGYDPLNYRKMPLDEKFTQQNLGKIFLQVEQNGEAWYINPQDKKRYYLGRPIDAFLVMQKLGLGITNQNLNQITIGHLNQITQNQNQTNNINNSSGDNILQNIADAIRANDTQKTISYFIPQMHASIEYSMEHLNAEQKFTLANILSGSTLLESADNQKTYSTKIYFQGNYYPAYFYVIKELSGEWYLSNL
ncbi:hypothetical protein A2331_06695 [Candidatus Falkowbacteria bacterium RIFOXYB2_FULL_34_18]|uniref:EF-hand domain-containing protein n=1 Tax=Candidatus Falkowbacteria bacterium RIFOXYD2_FULL_34_120 TaxID=1798007 RepID=A0A1F5TRD1_9BACT|nr:MAG: hypothetical protein A2331_06695 [Candidatus Falkowbacteria bacterium RIFOXYB2_FULL_34_18]OGF29991.1 MAG: hypothetical protein A2500_03985 [Candidatus Falkowbacteria bacterium RIFOXYC12_FULL_34_55]OGF37152.1 MAG: hypothetical protein A2466_02535 [Candidatus Falkowbacteria bacterium RIFOXYC2_FULL_34_220]OGF39527.1 MAG: hypothetical protein A2515_04350 [Candidatus Falkowbacteria bacterium RIFOXYD12_FULL_34_57]OGF41490.1 MAG: hypothetical protein A2531_02250 [Candidatus Falkowbacteria bact